MRTGLTLIVTSAGADHQVYAEVGRLYATPRRLEPIPILGKDGHARRARRPAVTFELGRSDVGFGKLIVDDAGVTRNGSIRTQRIEFDEIRDIGWRRGR